MRLSNKNPLTRLLPGVALVALTACSPATDDAATVADATLEAAAPAEASALPVLEKDSIAWFDGTVEEAFEYAATSGRQVFLYWGAEWCPPCHHIKATVFKKREFIERSRLFVPVYLDGDSEAAQQIGEQFQVLGYPTMIVFDPAGNEVTRIPGGIDIEAYANVLDVALATVSPVSDLVARAGAADFRLSVGECRLLAYYSWGQDRNILAELEPASVFRAMYDACPRESISDRSRLYLTHMEATLNDLEEDDTLSPAQRSEAVAVLETVLGDNAVLRANLLDVVFGAPDLIEAATDPGATRDALATQLAFALDDVAADESLFATDRLYTYHAQMALARMAGDETLPENLTEQIRTAVLTADAATTDPFERQSVVNTAWGVLSSAGLDDTATELLSRTLESSSHPYYFMLGLSDAAQQSGRTEEAIAWLARAYSEADEGPATRFQWGYNYLVGLIEMVPEDTARIRDETLRVFTDLGDDVATAFYQRTKARMGRLEKKFAEWNTDTPRALALDEIRSGMAGLCQRIPTEDASRNTCESFLESA